MKKSCLRTEFERMKAENQELKKYIYEGDGFLIQMTLTALRFRYSGNEY